MVRGVVTPSSGEPDQPDRNLDRQVNQFSQKRLEEYGFHGSRCSDALKRHGGDFGLAYESLMSDCFDLAGRPEESGIPDSSVASSAREAMEDEKLALEAIYRDRFLEKLPGKLWEIRFDDALPFLTLEAPSAPSPAQPEQEVCRFFLRGHCKFGKRCRKSHQLKQQEEKPRKDPGLKPVSRLEVRFPGTGVGPCYPTRAALFSFVVSRENFPPSFCLKISTRLMEESVSLARDGLPSVFAVASLLEDSPAMEAILKEGPDPAYAFAPDLVPKSGTTVCRREDRGTAGAPPPPSSLDNREPGRERTALRAAADPKDDQRVRDAHVRKGGVEARALIESRKKLPAWKCREAILGSIRANQVTVISGMTGCGKSTQVPQFILDEWLDGAGGTGRSTCHVVCTQPRRISATGVAERVAAERDERVPGSVGYQIRLESKMSRDTRLTFCTTGVLLRRLESDPDLHGVTHVVVDEVHERSQDSDFLLMVLKDLLAKRANLKVVLMSATLNSDLFLKYFHPAAIPGVVEIPGKTFPVKPIFLEEVLDLVGYSIEEESPFARPLSEFSRKQLNDRNGEDDEEAALLPIRTVSDRLRDEELRPEMVKNRYLNLGCSGRAAENLSIMDFDKIDFDLIERVVQYVVANDSADRGSILVFLPGMDEIVTLLERLGRNNDKLRLIPLHSSLSSEEQSKVFERSSSARKVVLSTNLAETSITIDDCTCVIDAGRMKEKSFDSVRNMESLDTVWVARANAVQRRGRAGRVRPGVCFHLYTRFRFDHHLRHDPVPEILRAPLEGAVLRIKLMGPLFSSSAASPQGVEAKFVLAKLIQPPAGQAVDSALARLQDVGAICPSSGELTPLGFHLARLPVDVRIGKLIILGAVFRCLDSALTIAAALSYRTPFVTKSFSGSGGGGGDRKAAQQKKASFSIRNSDHLAVVRAVRAWAEVATASGGTDRSRSRTAAYTFAQENCLSHKTLEMLTSIKYQLAEALGSIGFLTNDALSVRRLEKAASGGYDGILRLTGVSANLNNDNPKVVVSVVAAALYPHVVQVLSPEIKYKQTASGTMVKPQAHHELRFRTKADGFVRVHPSSVVAGVGNFENPYLVYHERIKTSRVFVREVSMVPIYPLVLFGGGDGVQVSLHRGKSVVALDGGWIQFVTADHRVAECLREMRRELDDLLRDKIADTSLDLASHPRGKLIIDTLLHLLVHE